MGKGGGTVAALIWSVIWYVCQWQHPSLYFQLFSFLAITVIGVWTGNIVDTYWGKDSSKVVIDEVAGVGLTLIACPVTWYYTLAGLALFRLFDIAKPFGIRKTEDLPKGWGVMADDLLSGVYAAFLLQLLVKLTYQ